MPEFPRAIFRAVASLIGSVPVPEDSLDIARAAVDDPRFAAPEGWQWARLPCPDGASLRYGWVRPASARRGSVILLPGYTQSADEYLETARAFVAAGYAVAALEWRGQGASDRHLPNPQKAYSPDFAEHPADLVRLVESVVAPWAAGPIYLAGESMGGHLGLRTLKLRPDLFAAAAFASPACAFWTGVIPRPVARAVAGVMTGLGCGSWYGIGEGDWTFDGSVGGPADKSCGDRLRALRHQGLFLARPELRIGGATYGFVDAFFRSSDLVMAPGWTASIRTPVLIGYATQDRVVDAEATRAAAAALPRCRLVPYPQARHALFNEGDAIRRQWMHEILQFFDDGMVPAQVGDARAADPVVLT